MATTVVCPDVQTLQRLLLGQLPEPEASAMGDHLLHCDRCGARVAAVKADDTLVEAMRSQPTNPAGPPPEVLQALIERLSRQGPPIVAAAADETTATPAEAGSAEEKTTARSFAEALHHTAEKTEMVYDFLAPAENPGELGRLGSFRVLKVLGAGGMGVVFQAEDPHLERLVALKAMLPALASNPQAKQRFLREAKAAAAIEHDHIVPIFHVAEDRGVPYLAMPLLKGEPLDERLKREGKLPVSTALRITREIAEGLAAAHEHGLVHRDIKPGNIWLEGSRARVKILDFGLARTVGIRPT